MTDEPISYGDPIDEAERPGAVFTIILTGMLALAMVLLSPLALLVWLLT